MNDVHDLAPAVPVFTNNGKVLGNPFRSNSSMEWSMQPHCSA
ncbi:MAG TPA: hypothetical protein PLN54_11755 [Flavobacteriales bacterium]|nr:hypothetical protein [Flavobacteriales bacterium]